MREVGDSIAEILLTQGKIAIVDIKDYEWLSQYGWYAHKSRNGRYYARAYKLGTKDGLVYMHRLIMDAPSDRLVDHKDRDGLNNRRDNLRLCDLSLNGANKKARNKTGYKGVHFHLGRNKPFQAHIQFRNKRKSGGYYETAIEAAIAYDALAIEIFGEFALTNFPQDSRHDLIDVSDSAV